MRLLVTILFLFFSRNALSQANIIFDTDMGSDCDDAGALAVLNKLADKGEAKILGVIFSSGKNKFGIGVCDAINTYYGRPDLILGQYKGSDIGDSLDHYSRYIATSTQIYHHDTVDSAMDLVMAYRKILEKQPDSSVTILTVGHPYGLVLLLKDATCTSLIRRKVKKWVAMTDTHDKPYRDWNFGRNGVELYIDTLLKNWPTEVWFCGLGKEFITGNKKLPRTAMNNPVREAYHLWNKALRDGRFSSDQTAVLLAVRPSYFVLDSTGSLQQNNQCETYWDKEKRNSKQFRALSVRMSNSQFEQKIENLMSEAPSLRPNK